MTIFVMYVLPLILVGATFALGPFRRWAEKKAMEAQAQPDLVEKFQENVAMFLRETDPILHEEMREILRWTGQAMLDDGKLIRSFILFNRRIRAGEVTRKSNPDIEKAFDSLSENARHSFSRAMGYAFTISSYRSLLLGDLYRSMLLWILDSDNKEVRAPKQVVYSYRKARKIQISVDKRVHC